ncbi:MAG: hypothetical protein M3Z66_05790 [Chloroflexota bacterium]|nr:hypothetical protein [Chloroflexota bacterium]
MNLNPSNIETGLDVFGSDGDKIGSITDVYHGTGGSTTTSDYGQSGSTGDTGDIVVEEVDVYAVGPDTGMESSVPSGAGTTETSGSMGSGTTSNPTSPGTTWNPSATADQSSSMGTQAGVSGTSTASDGGYIKVDQGGILGLGAKHLYIPISAIQDIDPGNCVSLNVTKQQADDMYNHKPDWIDQTS